jgi:hypothetical protein
MLLTVGDVPPLPGRFLVLICVRGSVDHRTIVRLEGLGQLNIHWFIIYKKIVYDNL